MKKKPIIGVTLDLAIDTTKYSYSAFPWYALRQNYAEAILKVGGIPLMIPYQKDNINEILKLIDGLIISGGDGDIPPRLYSQELTKANVILNGERADFELILAQSALQMNLPFLGICNGMQILNVAMGGNLIQHISDVIVTDINHKQLTSMVLSSHPLSIIEGTLLSSLANKDREIILVNSSHRQAIGRVGENLIVSARAPDGVIEAIESSKHKFVLGVEWHPEYLHNNGLDENIFEAFISACISG